MVFRRMVMTMVALGLPAVLAGCSDSTGPDEDVVPEEAAPGPDNLTDGSWEVRGSNFAFQQGLFQWTLEPSIEITQTQDQVDSDDFMALLRWLPHGDDSPGEFRLVFQVKTTGNAPAKVEVFDGIPIAGQPEDVRAEMTGITGVEGWTEYELTGTVPQDSQGLSVSLQVNGGLERSTINFRSLCLETF